MRRLLYTKVLNSRYSVRRLFAVSIIAFSAAYLLFIRHHLIVHSQTCMTVDEVAADSRCLYIYNNNIFEKGTRSTPHQGNPCGTDITSLIPGSHLADVVYYLDPNYQASVCTAPTSTPTPTPSNTPTPTVAASSTSTPSPTPTSSTITPSPTSSALGSSNNLPNTGVVNATNLFSVLIVVLVISGVVLLIV